MITIINNNESFVINPEDQELIVVAELPIIKGLLDSKYKQDHIYKINNNIAINVSDQTYYNLQIIYLLNQTLRSNFPIFPEFIEKSLDYCGLATTSIATQLLTIFSIGPEKLICNNTFLCNCYYLAMTRSIRKKNRLFDEKHYETSSELLKMELEHFIDNIFCYEYDGYNNFEKFMLVMGRCVDHNHKLFKVIFEMIFISQGKIIPNPSVKFNHVELRSIMDYLYETICLQNNEAYLKQSEFICSTIGYYLVDDWGFFNSIRYEFIRSLLKFDCINIQPKNEMAGVFSVALCTFFKTFDRKYISIDLEPVRPACNNINKVKIELHVGPNNSYEGPPVLNSRVGRLIIQAEGYKCHYARFDNTDDIYGINFNSDKLNIASNDSIKDVLFWT